MNRLSGHGGDESVVPRPCRAIASVELWSQHNDWTGFAPKLSPIKEADDPRLSVILEHGG